MRYMSFNTASGKYCCNSFPGQSWDISPYIHVSIPQAVSTVATAAIVAVVVMAVAMGFNTASGKYCCNRDVIEAMKLLHSRVSIPQAVSTVAT